VNKDILVRDMVIRIHDDLLSLAHERRIAIKNESDSLEDYEIETIELNFKSTRLFSMYKKIYKYLQSHNLVLINQLFSILNDVVNLDDIPSVTSSFKVSHYNVYLSELGMPNTSFEKLSSISLIEHIEDIIDCLIEDYDKDESLEWLTKTEMQHLILLALYHDIGKISPLMSKYEISMSLSHEEKGELFISMIMEGGDFSDTTIRSLKRILKDMNMFVQGTSNSSVARFESYDNRSRVIELNRLAAKEKN